MITDRKTPELLSPAGDRLAMDAAISNGADAVYFGLSRFNARMRAANFMPSQLKETILYLHRHNVKGYVAFNTLIFPEELEDAAEYIRIIAESGADAVIVQDIGLAKLIHEMAPSLPIHASTQMTLTEPAAMEFAKTLGISRIILPRELSLDEIRYIKSKTSLELEVFVHGALCISYSGQCLASEIIGGRSANRGQCAQPCRLPYELIVDGKILDTGGKRYLLSPRDLAAYELLPELIEIGISGFKIEGRMKSATYVAAAIRLYRRAIDNVVNKQNYVWEDSIEAASYQSFSRGFTRGYLEGANHQNLVSGESPKSRGLFAGNVIRITKQGVVIKLSGDIEIHKGDGVVFPTEEPDDKWQGGRIYSVSPAPATGKASEKLVEVSFGRGDVDLNAITPGTEMWKTDDPRQERELKKTFSKVVPYHHIPLDIVVKARVGERMEITASDREGNTVTVLSDKKLDRARTLPLTSNFLFDQFSKLGGTPYKLETMEYFCDKNAPVMAPVSFLNEMRRRVVAEMSEKRKLVEKHEIAKPDALKNILNNIKLLHRAKKQETETELSVLVRNMEQAEATIQWAEKNNALLKIIYADFQDTKKYPEFVEAVRSAKIAAGLCTPRILKPQEETIINQIAKYKPDFVLVRNPGSMRMIQKISSGISLVGDFSLNVANPISLSLLADAGLKRIVPATELTNTRIESMISIIPPSLLELIVYHHPPMFHKEYCLYSARLSKGKNRDDCGFPCKKHNINLRDRTGMFLPVLPDTACRTTIYSGKAVNRINTIKQFDQLGINNFRIDFLNENKEKVLKVINSMLDL